ncbi:hypothetical protein Bca4012_055894 [Brassica carinata]|uniref:AWS domain-containing protein n=1 Tax=Brassica carinata TaxID=52824 RepID=A0A8X7VZN3_BRACI|nr:hypothetical protein Bca52824_014306 [Brassica carinata]
MGKRLDKIMQREKEARTIEDEMHKLFGVKYDSILFCKCSKNSACMTSKCLCFSTRTQCVPSCKCKVARCSNRTQERVKKCHQDVVVIPGAGIQTIKLVCDMGD